MERRCPTTSCTRERMRRYAAVCAARPTSARQARSSSAAAMSSRFVSPRALFARTASVTSRQTTLRRRWLPSVRSRANSQVLPSGRSTSRRSCPSASASGTPSEVASVVRSRPSSASLGHSRLWSPRSQGSPSAERHSLICTFMKVEPPVAPMTSTPTGMPISASDALSSERPSERLTRSREMPDSPRNRNQLMSRMAARFQAGPSEVMAAGVQSAMKRASTRKSGRRRRTARAAPRAAKAAFAHSSQKERDAASTQASTGAPMSPAPTVSTSASARWSSTATSGAPLMALDLEGVWNATKNRWTTAGPRIRTRRPPRA